MQGTLSGFSELKNKTEQNTHTKEMQTKQKWQQNTQYIKLERKNGGWSKNKGKFVKGWRICKNLNYKLVRNSQTIKHSIKQIMFFELA